MKIIIITHETEGLKKDAKLYKKYFEKYNSNYIVEIVFVLYNNCIEKCNSNDILLFLENIPNDIKNLKSKLNLFMPNQELFKDFNNLKYINTILCKTKIAEEMFNFMKKEHNLNYNVLYTKFSTYIMKELKNREIKKDPNLFVLLAGTSPYKNTAYVVYNWIKNNCYLDIDMDTKVKLYITCVGRCYDTLINDLKNYLNYDIKWDNTDTFIYKNLTIYNKFVDREQYYYLLSSANVVICPSSKEGYSHNINEARYFNSYVITVDMPPMNELIFDNVNGMLIKKIEKQEKKLYFTKFKLYSVYPDMDEMTEKIKYCIENKYKLNSNSRDFYNKDLKFFKSTIKKFINNI